MHEPETLPAVWRHWRHTSRGRILVWAGTAPSPLQLVGVNTRRRQQQSSLQPPPGLNCCEKVLAPRREGLADSPSATSETVAAELEEEPQELSLDEKEWLTGKVHLAGTFGWTCQRWSFCSRAASERTGGSCFPRLNSSMFGAESSYTAGRPGHLGCCCVSLAIRGGRKCRRRPSVRR